MNQTITNVNPLATTAPPLTPTAKQLATGGEQLVPIVNRIEMDGGLLALIMSYRTPEARLLVLKTKQLATGGEQLVPIMNRIETGGEQLMPKTNQLAEHHTTPRSPRAHQKRTPITLTNKRKP